MRLMRFLLLAAVATAPLLGCGGGLNGSSPNAVFSSATNAAADKDYATFARCFTDDSRDQMAFLLLFELIGVKHKAAFAASAGAKQQTQIAAATKTIDDLLKKYGLAADLRITIAPGEDPNESGKVSEVLAPVQDRAAFIGEAMATMEDILSSTPASDFVGAQLQDVQVEGNSAIGEFVGGERKFRQAITFVKTNAGWRLEMPKIKK